MAVRRASHQLPGVDPRSPIALSIPQHNLITSYQTLSNSPITKPFAQYPYSNSPHPFSFKNPTPAPSPISTPQRLFSFYEAFPTANIPRIQVFPQTQSQLSQEMDIDTPPAPHKPSTGGLKFLLQTGRVPSVLVSCPCGQGRQTTKHFLNECKHFTQERQGLLSASPSTPTPRTPRSPKSPAEARAIHVARKWRMKTLLGKYRAAVKKQEYGYGQIGNGEGMIGVGNSKRMKSPRPDIVELGKGGGVWGRRF